MEEDVAGDEVTAMAEALGVSVTRAAAMARAAGGVEGAVAAFYGDPTAPPPPPPDGDNDVDVLRAMLGPAAPAALAKPPCRAVRVASSWAEQTVGSSCWFGWS